MSVILTAPDKANEGDSVRVHIGINNEETLGYTFIWQVLVERTFFYGSVDYIVAGGSFGSQNQFIMPGQDVLVQGKVWIKAVEPQLPNIVYGQDAKTVALSQDAPTPDPPPDFTVQTFVIPDNAGVIEKEPDLPTYPLNSKVILRAFPNVGFKFQEWQAGSVFAGKAPSILITVGGNVGVFAFFTPVSAPPPPTQAVFSQLNVIYGRVT